MRVPSPRAERYTRSRKGLRASRVARTIRHFSGSVSKVEGVIPARHANSSRRIVMPHAAASRAFTLFRLAVFRHAGPIRVDLDIAPGVLDVLPSPGIALLKGLYPRVVGWRSRVGQLDEQRRAKQDREGESGNEHLHDVSPC